MRRTFLLLIAASALLACGDDSGITDGGNDATTADSGDSGNDATTTTDSGGNDATTTTDSGGNDATTTDSGGSTDGGADFACGNTTCNSASDYCLKISVGPDGGLPFDAGLKNDAASPGSTCQAYPVTCTADGGTPTCSCVQGNCSCADDAGAITVSCP